MEAVALRQLHVVAAAQPQICCVSHGASTKTSSPGVPGLWDALPAGSKWQIIGFVGALEFWRELQTYLRRADLPKTGRGAAAAATWIFRGDDRPWI